MVRILPVCLIRLCQFFCDLLFVNLIPKTYLPPKVVRFHIFALLIYFYCGTAAIYLNLHSYCSILYNYIVTHTDNWCNEKVIFLDHIITLVFRLFVSFFFNYWQFLTSKDVAVFLIKNCNIKDVPQCLFLVAFEIKAVALQFGESS